MWEFASFVCLFVCFNNNEKGKTTSKKVVKKKISQSLICSREETAGNKNCIHLQLFF